MCWSMAERSAAEAKQVDVGSSTPIGVGRFPSSWCAWSTFETVRNPAGYTDPILRFQRYSGWRFTVQSG